MYRWKEDYIQEIIDSEFIEHSSVNLGQTHARSRLYNLSPAVFRSIWRCIRQKSYYIHFNEVQYGDMYLKVESLDGVFRFVTNYNSQQKAPIVTGYIELAERRLEFYCYTDSFSWSICYEGKKFNLYNHHGNTCRVPLSIQTMNGRCRIRDSKWNIQCFISELNLAVFETSWPYTSKYELKEAINSWDELSHDISEYFVPTEDLSFMYRQERYCLLPEDYHSNLNPDIKNIKSLVGLYAIRYDATIEKDGLYRNIYAIREKNGVVSVTITPFSYHARYKHIKRL